MPRELAMASREPSGNHARSLAEGASHSASRLIERVGVAGAAVGGRTLTVGATVGRDGGVVVTASGASDTVTPPGVVVGGTAQAAISDNTMRMSSAPLARMEAASA